MSVHVEPPKENELVLSNNGVAEAAAIGLGKDLHDRKALNELNELVRTDKSETHIHRITLIYFYIMAILGLFFIAVVTYHFLTPDKWHFLTNDQVLRIHELIVSGGAGIFLDRAARKIR